MKLKFRAKMYLAFAIVIFFTISCFVLLTQLYLFPRMYKETSYSNLQLCIKLSENVDDYINRLDDVTKKIISNKTLLGILKKVDKGTELPTNYEMLTFNRELSSVISNVIALTALRPMNVNIFSKDGRYSFVYNQSNSSFQQILRDEAVMHQLENKQLVIFPSSEGNEKDCLSLVRPIFDIRASMYGYVEVQVDFSELRDICNINEAGRVYIVLEEGKIIYPCDADVAWPEAFSDEFMTRVKSGTIDPRDGNTYFYAASKSVPLITIVVYPTRKLYASFQLLQQVFMWFCMAVMLVAFVLFAQFSRMLVGPLHELRDSVLNVSYRNMGLSLTSTKNDEITVLRDAFQHILNNLKVSIEKEVAANKAEAKARMSALQSQIAPHFIHNTLYMISICAQEQRTDDAVNMCKQLSDMMRYTIDPNSETVLLKEEMTNIENYLSLQAQQYEDFLQYSVDWYDEQESLIIPRLSLLPFVENVIHHAFCNQRPPYRIQIHVEVKNSHWSAIIADNGCGFDEATIQGIHDSVAKGQVSLRDCVQRADKAGMGGMGIPNTLLRLRLFFGDSFRYEISNGDRGGARIILEGPCDRS